MPKIDFNNNTNQQMSALREMYAKQQLNKKKSLKEISAENDKKRLQRADDDKKQEMKRSENSQKRRKQTSKTGKNKVDFFA